MAAAIRRHALLVPIAPFALHGWTSAMLPADIPIARLRSRRVSRPASGCTEAVLPVLAGVEPAFPREGWAKIIAGPSKT